MFESIRYIPKGESVNFKYNNDKQGARKAFCDVSLYEPYEELTAIVQFDQLNHTIIYAAADRSDPKNVDVHTYYQSGKYVSN